MKIISETKNSLLKRREIKASLESQTNPGFKGVSDATVQHFKVSAEQVVVREVNNGFGKHSYVVSCFVYDSPEFKESIEQKPKIKKGAEGGAK